tara:strand:+ start:802 stop:1776 length:975 start_codon:yes stop_codon:yes gene_type:complete
MYVINHDKKYVIYMYPKSGCSTLRVLHAYLSTPPDTHAREHFEDLHHGIQRRDDDALRRHWPEYADYCKVLVYRDPYARVVSLFFQKVCGVPGVTYGGVLYEEPVRLGPSLRTFADFVRVLVTGRFEDDEHFRPQKFFALELDAPTLPQRDAQTLPKPDAQTLPKPDAQTLLEVDAQTLADLEPQTLPKLDAQTPLQLDAQSLADLKPQTLPKPDAQTLAELKPDALLHFDQVLEISAVRDMFAGRRPDLHGEVAAVLAKTQKEAWNALDKVAAAPGSYAHYDFFADAEGFRASRRVPCAAAMLTPEICALLETGYGDDFVGRA